MFGIDQFSVNKTQLLAVARLVVDDREASCGIAHQEPHLIVVLTWRCLETGKQPKSETCVFRKTQLLLSYFKMREMEERT